MVLILIALFIALRVSLLNRSVGSQYTKIRNQKIKLYLLQRQEDVLRSCLGTKESMKYYTDLYSHMVNEIYKLEKKKYIQKKDRKILFSILKEGNSGELLAKIRAINPLVLDDYFLSKKNLLLAMAYDMNFYDYGYVEKFYRDAMENDKFDLDNYRALANFYQKNCSYDEAINTLARVASVAKNSNQRIDLSGSYGMLGNLYMVKRDYENALANFTNALVVLDFKNADSKKGRLLVNIGDIMAIRGDNFEAINCYKYALGLGNFNKRERTLLLLKLSNSYYSYGNYEMGLKFAKDAVKRSKKSNQKELHHRAKYFECLNYEYLQEEEKAKESCQIALEEAETHKNEKDDFESHIMLTDMLDYSCYLRNPTLALEYLQRAGQLIRHPDDIYKKVQIMEKIASIKAYHCSPNEKIGVLRMYEELDNIYRHHSLETGCCNNILAGFVKEQLKLGNVEKTYEEAEKQLKNRKAQLATLYIYMSDYYRDQNMPRKALIYAKKALEIDSQIYRFDHHYINYAREQVENIRRQMAIEER